MINTTKHEIGIKVQTRFIVAPAWQHIFSGTRATDTRWIYDKANDRLIAGQAKDRKGGRWNNLVRSDIDDLAESLAQNECFAHPKAFGLIECRELPSWADGCHPRASAPAV